MSKRDTRKSPKKKELTATVPTSIREVVDRGVGVQTQVTIPPITDVSYTLLSGGGTYDATAVVKAVVKVQGLAYSLCLYPLYVMKELGKSLRVAEVLTAAEHTLRKDMGGFVGL